MFVLKLMVIVALAVVVVMVVFYFVRGRPGSIGCNFGIVSDKFMN